MMENLKMLVVLTLISGACGFLLAGVNSATAERIEEQVMKYVKGPAVKSVLKGSDNDATIIQDRKKIKIGDKEMTVFIGKKGGGIWSVAFESVGDGFGGEVGVMVGYDVKKDELAGIGITSHKETPGVGSRVTQELFTKKFRGLPVSTDFRLKKDQGDIDALTGATVSSTAVSMALEKNVKLYEEVKSKVKNL